MRYPTRRYPFDAKYDFSYRPETYWPETPSEETVLATVKGTARRDLARQAIEQGKDTPLGAIDVEFALAESLTEPDRREWGAIHPALMGGEYLPDPAEHEVEIARIELASTTGDVIQVLAHPSRPTAKRPRIRYRVVDEYMDEGSEYETVPKSSSKPLTFGQLIDLIDLTRSVGTNAYAEDEYNVGLVESVREYNYASGEEAESLRRFVRVTSAFYPQLEAYFDERAEHWCRSIALERLDEELEWYPDTTPFVRLPRPVPPARYRPDKPIFCRRRHPMQPLDEIDRDAVELWMRYRAGLDGFSLEAVRAIGNEGESHSVRVRATWRQGDTVHEAELENCAGALLPLAKKSPRGSELLERDLADNAVSVELRVELALRMGRKARAVELLGELSKVDPLQAAKFMEWLGRGEEAVALYREVATDSPMEAGWGLLRAGLADEAEQAFRAASADCDALLGLAAVARQRGDAETALALYEQWAEVVP